MATFHRDGTSVDNTASANDSEPKSASQASSNFTTYFGLQNEGNTCFLNSLLQCLYLTPEFQKLSRCESECGETLSEIKKIFNALQKKKSVSTSKLAACLGLKPFKQQDVPEVFHLLLNKLDHELSNGLLFKKLYESTMVSLTECTQCVKKDGLHIGCNIVILPLPVSSLRNGEQCCSVTDALEHFLRSSEMKGENQIYCSDCREKTDATLRQALTRLPRILVVQLKRFDFSFYEQRFVKLDNAMHINTTLEVPCEMELQKDKKSYDLFAICDHYGGFKSGHYSAIIKPEENDKWFRFDDSIVTSEEILDPEREKSLRGKSSGEKYDLSRSRTAYVLMYRQKLEREPQKSAPFPTDLWTPQPSALPMVIPQDTTGASLLLPTQKSRNGPAHAMVLNVRGDNEIEIMHGSDETAEPVHLVDLLHNERNAEQKVDALTRQNGDAEHVPNMQTRRNELQSAEVINICMPQNDLGVVQAASRLQSHIAVKSEGVPNTKKPQNEQTSESNTNIRVSQGNQIGDVIKHFFCNNPMGPYMHRHQGSLTDEPYDNMHPPQNNLMGDSSVDMHKGLASLMGELFRSINLSPDNVKSDAESCAGTEIHVINLIDEPCANVQTPEAGSVSSVRPPLGDVKSDVESFTATETPLINLIDEPCANVQTPEAGSVSAVQVHQGDRKSDAESCADTETHLVNLIDEPFANVQTPEAGSVSCVRVPLGDVKSDAESCTATETPLINMTGQSWSNVQTPEAGSVSCARLPLGDVKSDVESCTATETHLVNLIDDSCANVQTPEAGSVSSVRLPLGDVKSDVESCTATETPFINLIDEPCANVLSPEAGSVPAVQVHQRDRKSDAETCPATDTPPVNQRSEFYASVQTPVAYTVSEQLEL